MRRNWLYGFLIFVGCSSRMPLSPPELCEGIQKAHCARLYQCATTPELQAALTALYADQDDCVMTGITMQKPVCSQWTEAKACGGAGILTWNGDAAPTCLTDINALSCAKTLTGTLPASCTPSEYCQ